nr:PREDICTED: cyclic AMP-dependent transcription factor ATF-6 beta [Latimeria chalumnae]|eukprot:XP_014347021.1 PREDICTED: cyclic AMP-dependent transcription factor ATF-6 beta [Latimeria chalumnae]
MEADLPANLFNCMESEHNMFETDLDLCLDAAPSDAAWTSVNEDIFADLQVKSEPLSPTPSHCSESSLSSASETPYLQQITNLDAAVTAVKVEDPPTPPYMFGDVLSPPLNNVRINLVASPDCTLSPVKQRSPAKGAADLKTDPIFISKPAIQPKPVVVTKTTTVPVPQSAGPAKTIILQSVQAGLSGTQTQPLPIPAPSLVLSQNDLLRLPMPGLIKLETGGLNGVTAAPARHAGGNSAGIGSVKTPTKPIIPAPTPLAAAVASEIDMKRLKRQQRMIKNRESACQSRKKKKEYLQGLESRLQEVLSENESLRRENTLLKKKLDGVLSENQELRFGSGNRKTMCVMVVLLFIVFNFGPVSLSERKLEPFPQPGQERVRPQTGRQLLEFKDSLLKENGAVLATEEEQEAVMRTGEFRFRNVTASFTDVKDLVLRDIDHFFSTSDCRQFNKTESLRLADELRGWVHRHQIERKKSNRKPTRPKKLKVHQKAQKKMLNLSRYVAVANQRNMDRDASSQLQLYQRPEQSYYDFMDAIDRREDTFYVVSFRRDHLLLPAISHNKTTRPKMSLVMPAMALNESLYNSSRGYEVMMQIDCEVMDTRMIQIKSSTVPTFLRQRQDNRTAPAEERHDSGRADLRGIRPHRVPLPPGHSKRGPSLYFTDSDGV